MNYISCRANGTDADDFSPNLLLSRAGKPFKAWVAGDYWTGDVMVHGYNTQFENVTDAYRANAEMARETGLPELAGFLWPGLGDDKLESLEFYRAQDHARKAGAVLADFLSRHVSSQIYAKLTVITHSLGALVALEALRLGAHVETLALTGPAVAHDCLSTAYADALANVDRVLVYYSRRDPVLGTAFKFDQFTDALGSVGPAPGFDPLKVKSFDRSATVATHNDYRHDRGIWQSIKENQL